MKNILKTSEIIKCSNKYSLSEYKQSVEKMNKKELQEFCLLIEQIKDPFHSLALLLRIQYKTAFVNDGMLNTLSTHIEKVKEERYVKINTLDEKVLNFIIKYAENSDMAQLMPCLSHLEISNKNIKHLRKYFSYNRIYQYFKKISQDILSFNYRRQEVALAIRLLNSPSLCFKNLYLVIKKLAKYAKLRTVDKTVIECSKIIGCVLKYEPKAFSNHDDYLTSILSFFCGVLSNIQNYIFLKLNDLDEMLLAIERTSHYLRQDTSHLKLFSGLYANAYDILYKYQKVAACLEEDLLCLSTNLRLVHILYEAAYLLGLRAFLYDQFYNDIVSIKYSKPVNLPISEYKQILSRLFLTKYSLLGTICKDAPFNTDMFVNDIVLCNDTYGIFKAIRHIEDKVEISRLIDIAITDPSYECHVVSHKKQTLKNNKKVNDDQTTKPPDVQENEAQVVDNASMNAKEKTCQDNIKFSDKKNYIYLLKYTIREYFLKQNNFNNNVDLYKKALFDKKDIVITIFTNTFVNKMNNLSYNDSHLDLLSFLLALGIANRNSRIVRKKENIILSAVKAMPKDKVLVFLKMFIANLRAFKYFRFNPFFISTVISFNKRFASIKDNIITYIIDVLEYNDMYKEKDDDKNTSSNNEGAVMDNYRKMYISTACYICTKHKLKVSSGKVGYYKVIIALMNGINQKYDDDYQNHIKNDILQIVFDVNETQRNSIKRLYHAFIHKENSELSQHMLFYKSFVQKMEKQLRRNKKKTKSSSQT